MFSYFLFWNGLFISFLSLLQAFLLKNILFSRESSNWRQLSGRLFTANFKTLLHKVMPNSDVLVNPCTAFSACVCLERNTLISCKTI